MSAGAIRGGRVAIEIGADVRNFYSALNALQGRIKGFGSAMTGLGTRMAGIGAAAGLPFAAALKQSAAFQDTMSAVGAVTGATGADFEALKQKALDLGAGTSFTAQEVAEGMQALGQGGFTVEETMSGIEGTLLLARAGMLGLGDASSITVAILRSFKMPALEAAKVADVLSLAANSSNATVQGLGEGISTVGGIAYEAGISLTELTASLGLLADRGMQASESGTAMRRILIGLAQEQDKLKALGVDVKDPKTGKLKPLKDILGDLNQAMAGMDTTDKISKLSKIFDVFGANAVIQLMNAGDALGELDAKLQNADGTAAVTARKMDDNLGGSFRMMTSAIEAVALAVGEALTPKLREVMGYATEVAAGFAAVITKNKELAVTVFKSIVAFTAIGGALIGAGVSFQVVAMAIGGFAAACKLVTGPMSAVVSSAALIVKSFTSVTGTVGSIASSFVRAGVFLAGFAAQAALMAVSYAATIAGVLASTLAAAISIGAAWTGAAIAGLLAWAAYAKAVITYHTGMLTRLVAITISRAGQIAGAWVAQAGRGIATFVAQAVAGLSYYLANVAACAAASVSAAATTAAAWLAPVAPFVAIAAAIAAVVYAIQNVDLIGMFSGLPALLGPLAEGFAGVAASAMQAFAEIFSIARDTFTGIYDAITAGDLSLAFTVLWAGLQAAWLTGSATIMGYVDQLTEYFQNVWSDAITWLAIAITNGMGVVQDIWTAATHGMMDAWTYAMNAVMDLWDSAVGAIQKAIAYIRSFFDKSIDYDAVKKQIDEANKQRKDERDKAAAEANPELAAQVQRNREQRRQAIDTLNKDNERGRGERAGRTASRAVDRELAVYDANINAADQKAAARQAKEAQDMIASAKQAGSQDELREAYDWAKTALENGRITQEQFDAVEAAIDAQAVDLDKTRAMGEQEKEKADRAAEDATNAGKGVAEQKAETAGTFSTAAVFGMGFQSNVAERTARAAEETARNTKEMREGAKVQA